MILILITENSGGKKSVISYQLSVISEEEGRSKKKEARKKRKNRRKFFDVGKLEYDININY
ncbi:hypothetical protein [Okeania sp. KiyG1]|uniref:hypothetical protein n=1 Tax=Okeania sp. KiyG1 TaxID=2720165 RepID=UPI0019242FB4|nr:hypothetical protein [Okeania sp. KiyG1]